MDTVYSQIFDGGLPQRLIDPPVVDNPDHPVEELFDDGTIFTSCPAFEK
jgi:hypothetical protein